ncbi:MAG TPA: hypothetical protein VNO32_62205, partial [Candidatus Acidoferrum sp.]|nr:hypothetical protein [Candidatus Acidoferrum sp.]
MLSSTVTIRLGGSRAALGQEIKLTLTAAVEFPIPRSILTCATTPHLQSIVQQVFSKNSGGSSRQRQGRRAVTPMALPRGHERLP